MLYKVRGHDLEQWLCDTESHWKGALFPTCNLIEPPKTIRRVHRRFDPIYQELRQYIRAKQR
jgi:hypothetical protein